MWTVLFEISSWFLVLIECLEFKNKSQGDAFMSEVWTRVKKSESEFRIQSDETT